MLKLGLIFKLKNPKEVGIACSKETMFVVVNITGQNTCVVREYGLTKSPSHTFGQRFEDFLPVSPLELARLRIQNAD